MDSQVKRVRDNRRVGGGGCHRRRRGLREAQDCGCCGALVKKIGVIRATFLTSACQESKMTTEGGCLLSMYVCMYIFRPGGREARKVPYGGTGRAELESLMLKST